MEKKISKRDLREGAQVIQTNIHKRQVFLVRGLRDKRENHVTSGIGLVSRSRVSPVYNQEREN